METLKEFLEAKLAKCGFSNFKWVRRDDDTVYVTATNLDELGVRVTMSLAELTEDLLWQESGI